MPRLFANTLIQEEIHLSDLTKNEKFSMRAQLVLAYLDYTICKYSRTVKVLISYIILFFDVITIHTC